MQVSAAPVTHFDLSVARGEHRPGPPLPYVPGTDGAGRVLDSETYEPGTDVRIGGGGLGVRRDGTWADRVVVPDGALEPIPRGIEPGVAAAFAVPTAAAFTALEHVGRLQPGERVAVTGAAGAVGSIAVQLARRRGAAVVYGIVTRPGKVRSVPAGATTLVGRGPEVVERIRDEAGGVDLLVDTVGGAGLAQLLPAVSPGGRVVMVGYAAGTSVTLDLPTLIELDVSLLTLNLFRQPTRTREAAAKALELFRHGDLQLPLTRFPIEDVTSAVQRLAAGEAVGRVVLVPAREQRSANESRGGGNDQVAA
ncbi:MAG TPA: zinc-binding dehydrogenase [Acidimicrobiales bacterium]|nr:zinc-binding dehydrogenase [Acidimicrobiales bacterium]